MTTQVLINIRDSVGQPISGKLKVTLESYLSSGAIAYVPVLAEVDIPATTSIDLEPTIADRVSYRFEVFQGSSLVWVANAVVPDVATCNLSDLLDQTGLARDLMDTSIDAIVRRLYYSEDFWARVSSSLFVPRGQYSPTAYYSQVDLVSFNGQQWRCLSPVPIQNIQPVEGVNWTLFADRGASGSGTTGVVGSYNSSWNGSNLTPTRDALFQKIEGLAPVTAVLDRLMRVNGQAEGLTLNPIPSLAAVNNEVITANWYRANTASLVNAQTPVGAIMGWLTSTAPTGWLLLDGRTVSRTTYQTLFALWGTTFNTGGEAGTEFRLPDFRGRTLAMVDTSPLTGIAGNLANTFQGTVIGSKPGSDAVTLTVNQIPSHTHNSGWSNVTGGVQVRTTAAGTDGATNVATGSAGGGQSHLNMQPTFLGNYIVYTGVV